MRARSLARPWFILLALAACGARSGLMEGTDPSSDGPRRADAPRITDTFTPPDAGRACTTDADCATSNPCIRSTCGPAGTCVDRPRPMGQVKELPSSGLLGVGTSSGSLAYGLARVQHALSARPFTLDGPAGGATPLGTVGGTRPWDSVIAAVPGGGLAMVTSVEGGLELRRSEQPGAMDRIKPGGIFIRLASSGARLVATADLGHNCGVAWADAKTGKWTTQLRSTPGGCTGASLPHGDPPGGSTGLPPWIHPIGFNDKGAAILLSLASDGKGTRLTAAPDGSLKKDAFSLASPGLKHFHSLAATRGGGGVGALWCRTEHADSKTNQVNMALLDRASLKPLGPVSTRTVKGRPYALYMDMVWCEGRYVGIWYDATGAAAWQMAPDGTPLGPVLRFDRPLHIARIDAVCVEGGVVLFAASRVVTLRCPGV